MCPKEDIEKDDHFEDIFVPDSEKESIHNKTWSGADFIVADGVVLEIEEGENQVETEDDTYIFVPDIIVID